MKIYPNNFESKVGFTEIRNLLKSLCSNKLSKEYVDNMSVSSDYNTLFKQLQEIKELMYLMDNSELELPILLFENNKDRIKSLFIDGIFLEEEELLELKYILFCYSTLRNILIPNSNENVHNFSTNHEFPFLSKLFLLTNPLPYLYNSIENLLTPEGKIKDSATKELFNIRRKLNNSKSEITHILNKIFINAKKEGWIESDAKPILRDGRIVLPIIPMYKRNVGGIVHDESSTGKTLFIEPQEVLEANNNIRELELAEKKEIIRILKKISKLILPNINNIIDIYCILGYFDFIRAKCLLAKEIDGNCPDIVDKPILEYLSAKHPILLITHKKNKKLVVPIDITLDNNKQKILIISGPNSGGKSVCLKTVGILQYMIQCGLPIPVLPNSKVGIFSEIFIDIGDEQSIEDDLSTYSSHLKNMKFFLNNSTNRSIILIDEFGTGTEPIIGGAIACSILNEFYKKKVNGVITTHYKIIKDFAEKNYGIMNASMLYDRNRMIPLFKLLIGYPGSSFAVEIAKNIGLSQEIIEYASNIVGKDYINQDKFLQDIIRDKNYWNKKRSDIKLEKKELSNKIDLYNSKLEKLKQDKINIINTAKLEANKILENSNRIIELTVKKIIESNANKDITRELRSQLYDYKKTLINTNKNSINNKDQIDKNDIIKSNNSLVISNGDYVRVKSYNNTIGLVIRIIRGNRAELQIENMKVVVPLEDIEICSPKDIERKKSINKFNMSASIIDIIHNKRLNFCQDIDVRGLRSNEALQQISIFLDEALQLSINKVRILHGTGTGSLKMAIREYLSGIHFIKSYKDEDIRFGGAGITVVNF